MARFCVTRDAGPWREVHGPDGGRMLRQRQFLITLILTMAAVSLVACNVGPAASGSFDRNYTVTGLFDWSSATPPATWTSPEVLTAKCTCTATCALREWVSTTRRNAWMKPLRILPSSK